MGLNSRHDVTNDKASGYNLTRKNVFKFELLSNIDCRKIEVAQNLSMNQIKVAIKINGMANIQIADKLKVLNKIYKVVSIESSIDNSELFKKRNDIENFTGDTIVGLE